MSSSTTLLPLSSISTASAPNSNHSNLMDTKNNNNENDTYSYIASLRKIEERYQCTDYIKIKESKDRHIIDGNCRARGSVDGCLILSIRWTCQETQLLQQYAILIGSCVQPRRLLLIEKSINLVSMSSHLTLRNKHRCISISSCYSTRVLTHSSFIFPFFILFVS